MGVGLIFGFCGVWGRFLSLVRVIGTGHGAPTGLEHRSRLYPGLTPGATNVPPPDRCAYRDGAYGAHYWEGFGGIASGPDGDWGKI